MRQEGWEYRGSAQSGNLPPVIVESSWDDPTSMEEERIVGVSNVQVLASMFEVPADFVVNGRDPASTARLLIEPVRQQACLSGRRLKVISTTSEKK